MGEQIWKHLPYAIYMDTNAMRSAGPLLERAWVVELLSITNEYGIGLFVSELVLSEWCQHIADVLTANREKMCAASRLLRHYEVAAPTVEQDDVALPTDFDLIEKAKTKLRAVGIEVVPNADVPLTRLLEEAVRKVPPFEPGGKGLCDAVILETFAKHAKDDLGGQRVLVVSNDKAVQRSTQRFRAMDIDVEFIENTGIVVKLSALLNDEISSYLASEKTRLKEYVLSHEDIVLEFVRRAPLAITDWMLNPPLSQDDRINGAIESIISIRPTRISDVIDHASVYGETLPADRYPITISVELEIDVMVRDWGFGLSSLMRTR
ncbi:MAG: PIN domain-containing protein, partial [bacterium]